jgi:MFS transporter, FHS family, glucose/mannose:H+ symporter
MPQRSEVFLVYLTGLAQGLALVTFPAASSIFTSPHGYDLSASDYGLMFVPQVILAIAASSLGPSLAKRWSLKRVLQAGLSANLLAMALLAFSALMQHLSGVVYGILLVATGSLGFGFGATVMALNTYAAQFFPRRADRAILALNALLGAGTALAPLFVAIFVGLGVWWILPVIVAVALMALLLCTFRTPLQASVGDAKKTHGLKWFPLRFWLYAAAVLLYGIVETLNGNWSGQYLTGERGVSAQGASYALTAFWAMVTIGRVLFATLSSKIEARWIYAGLPILLVAAFQVVSRANSQTSGIVAFGFAGLGCSAFFPLCISLSGQEFPRLAAAMAGAMVAFYQAGYGVAAFGVGPLRTFTGLSFRTIYSFGSLVAGAILAVSLAVAFRPSLASTHPETKAA